MGLYDETVEAPRRTMTLFFVIDTSGSMAGTKIGSINQAICEVVPEIAKLSADNADAEIKIAAMKFGKDAEWITPQPVKAEDFLWTDLNTYCSVNAEFGVVCDELNKKLSRRSFMCEPCGSYAPAVFLLSGSTPTDNYRKKLEELRQNKWFQKAIKVAIAIGNEADKDALAEFTGTSETVLEAHSPEMIMKLIKFVSVRASQIGSKSMSALPIEKNNFIPSKQEDFAEWIQRESLSADIEALRKEADACRLEAKALRLEAEALRLETEMKDKQADFATVFQTDVMQAVGGGIIGDEFDDDF